jgi:hypothetical protein
MHLIRQRRTSPPAADKRPVAMVPRFVEHLILIGLDVKTRSQAGDVIDYF